MVFAIMGGKSKSDYKAVFTGVHGLLGTCKLQEMVVDFEAAMWVGVRWVFPDVHIQGCCFHWVQAILRHIQGCGLQEAYNKDEGTHTFLRKPMALPFV